MCFAKQNKINAFLSKILILTYRQKKKKKDYLQNVVAFVFITIAKVKKLIIVAKTK